jgi:N6-adenosine-specific RNA methylase IME4
MTRRSKPKKATKPKRAPRAKAKVRKAKTPRPIIMRGQETRWPREIKLDKIVLRRDMGDLERLAKSIDERGGLLHPVVITSENFLIAGQRRLEAWKQTEKFRKEPIPVTVIDVDSILAGERDENGLRKDFTPSESVELYDALIVEAQLRARERQAHGKTAPGKKSELNADASADKGTASDQVAGYLGRDRKTIARARDVVEAAKAEPKRFGSLLDRMDKTGNVNGPFRVLKVMRQVEDIKAKKAAGKLDLPEGQFDRIVGDMPWPYEPGDTKPDTRGRAVRGYATMSLDAMKAMPIAERAARDCVLYMWVTGFHMRYAYEVLDAWGFTHAPLILVWTKDKFGKRQRLREICEFCIIAIKGKPVWNLTNQTTRLDAPVREDSRKPDEFYALIDELTPAQRSLELFARRELPEGWEGFGDQVGKFKATKTEKNIPGNIPAPVKSEGFEAKPCVWASTDPRRWEMELLAAIGRGDNFDPALLDGLRKQKLVTGKAQIRLSELGRGRLIELEAASTIPDPVQPEHPPLTYTVAGMRDQIDTKTLDILRQADERGLIQWQADGDHSVAFIVSTDGKSFGAVSANDPHLPNYDAAIELRRHNGKVEVVTYHDEHHGGGGLVFHRLNMPFHRVEAFLLAWRAANEPAGETTDLASDSVEKIDIATPATPAEPFDDEIPEILRRKPRVQQSEVAS